MRIDLVIGSLQIGGAEQQVVGLAQALMTEGHDVHVISLFGTGTRPDDVYQLGVPVITFPRKIDRGLPGAKPLTGLLIAISLTKYWARRKPDAVQVWLPHAQLVALPIAAALRIPIRVLAIRNMSSSVRGLGGHSFARRFVSFCSTVVVSNSKAALSDSGWHLGALPRVAVGNGVIIPPQAATPELGANAGVMVANLRAHKGHLDLLEALAQMDDPPTMDLIGSGVQEARVRSAIDRLGLAGRVRLLTQVEDVSSLLHGYTFAVLPSYFEGIPNALLESMATGLPVIATRVGGIPEIVEDGETGLLVAPGDVKALANAITLLSNDPALRASMGRAGRESAKAFTWERVLKGNLNAMWKS